jgi:peptide/nickel transport system substrate-binding protein
MSKYLWCMCVALVTMSAVVGCGSSKNQAGNTASNGAAGSSKSYSELRWGATPFGGPLDWDKNPESVYISAIESLAVQSLMQYESNGTVKPGLASSVEQPNPATYVYHLRSVKFSDGKQLTSADVVYSLDRVVNGKESWTKSFWSDVASITAPNSETVTVKLKRPSVFFQNIVAFSGLITEKASTESMGEKEIGTPGHMLIGTGPWKLDSYAPGASVVLSRNPYWTGTRPPAEKITIDIFKTEAAVALALRSGAIDGTALYSVPKEFLDISGARQLKSPGATTLMLIANTEQKPFNDVHVRRAIAYATDTQGMIGALYPDGAASQDYTVMPNSLFTNLGSQSEVNEMLEALPKYEFSLAKAKQELARSAYPHGFSTPIEVESGVSASVDSAQILAADLNKIGINAKVDELTPAQATVWSAGKAHLAIGAYGSPYADPESVMSLILDPAQIPGLNEANYRNSEVDRLRAESAETLNKPKRLQLLGKLLKIVNSEVPYRQMLTAQNFASVSEKYVYSRFSWWTQLSSPWALNVKLAS